MVSDAARRRCEEETEVYFACRLSMWSLMCGRDQTKADYNALIDKHELRFNSIPITYDKRRKPSEFPTYENQRNKRLGNMSRDSGVAAFQNEACSNYSHNCASSYKTAPDQGRTPEYRSCFSGRLHVLEKQESCRLYTKSHAGQCHDREGMGRTRSLCEFQKESCSNPCFQKQEFVGGHRHRTHVWHLEPSCFDGKENHHVARQRTQPKHEGDFEIYVEDIFLGIDRRTTCMIKNIPNKYSLKMLVELLDEDHHGEYNFVYLRMDFKNKCNVGYAFVNFANCMSIISFYRKVHGKSWKRFTSNKICELTYASIQGFSKLVNKFRNSSVMQEKDSFRPKIFYTRGPQKGLERKLL